VSAIKYNDRVLVLGDTGAGKSELLNWLFAQLRNQRLLLDTKDEFSVPDITAEPEDGKYPTLKPTRNVEDIDWSQPIIHYIPTAVDRKGGLAEMEALFTACFHSPHPLTVFTHEVSDVCQYQTNATPPSFDRYVAQGRVHGKGIVAGTQLPVDIPKRIKALSQHIIVLVPAFDRPEDRKAVANLIAMGEQDGHRVLETLHQEMGDFAFVHYRKGPHPTTANLPLSEAARATVTITRRADA
jgi:energy-coupling factor transporter ATP-binding protein EcfA2